MVHLSGYAKLSTSSRGQYNGGWWYALGYTLSLVNLSSAAFDIVRGTMKGVFAQLFRCGAHAHTIRHGRSGRRR